MWSRTTGIQKEWAAGGETIIPTISKQRISGAMKKKDRPEWMTDGRSADTALFPAFRGTLWVRSVRGWRAPESFLLEKSERTWQDEVPLASVDSVGKRQVVCRRMCHSFRADMRQSDSVLYHRHLLSFAKSGGQIIVLRSEEV